VIGLVLGVALGICLSLAAVATLVMLEVKG
jgi:hypothetical protein